MIFARRKFYGVGPVVWCVLLSVFVHHAADDATAAVVPPPVVREMRAAWVATVANIDWPSTNNLSTARQKAELVAIMNRATELRLNTIIFQVRPACDALYNSPIEPWSEYLTGTMGHPPKPAYDPLAFAIEEAHKRGLELHAWFNPFRARQASAKSPIASTHVSKTHPEFVRKYGKSLWLDPGERAAQAFSLGVVMDVVKRYDVDGVHFDDYFYPYKEQDASGKEMDFPDGPSWQKYGLGGKLTRDDWRRENVNAFVHQVYDSIKAIKPWVRFGISPFGIWRPGNPPQIQGLDAYAKLYADSRLWLAKGWVDYFAPQLYWGIGQKGQSFPVLLNWWAEQNVQSRNLAPGLDDTKVGRQWSAEEIVRQIGLTHSPAARISGHIHWSMKALMQNPKFASDLAQDVYGEPALSPPMPWLEHSPPSSPVVGVTGGRTRVNWKSGAKDDVWLWVVQRSSRDVWTTTVLPRTERTLALGKPKPETVAVTAVDRYGNSSTATVINLGGRTK